MKNRFMAAVLGLTTVLSLVGCAELEPGDVVIPEGPKFNDLGDAGTISDSTDSDTSDVGSTDSESSDAGSADIDSTNDNSSEEAALDGIFVYRFSPADNLFFTDDEEFYEDFFRTSVDAQLQIQTKDGTIGDVAEVWTSRIKATAKAIKDSGKLTADQSETLDRLVSGWDDYDPRCRRYYSNVFGTGSSFYLGSMYTEMMPDVMSLEYQIFEGVLMSIERELTGINELNLAVLTKDQDISGVTALDFDERSVCMAGGRDFEECAELINLDNIGEQELLWYAAAFNDEIGLGDEEDAVSAYSVNYKLISNKLGDLGGSVTGDSLKIQNYYETMARLRTIRLMDAYLLTDQSKIEYAGYLDDDRECFRIAIERSKEQDGEYSHLRDYFYMDGAFVNVDYPSRSDSMDSDRYVCDACDFSAELVDVTFDGHKDLVISLGHQGAHGTEEHCAYVYEDGRYKYKKSFEKIPNYSLDIENKKIHGWVRSNAEKTNEFSFVYKDGEFVEE